MSNELPTGTPRRTLARLRGLMRAGLPKPIGPNRPPTRWTVPLAGIIAVLFAGLAIHCAPARRLGPTVHVVGVAPEGTIWAEETPLTITFETPVISEAAVGATLERPPVHVEPEIELQAHFRDRQTLVLEPTSPLQKGTEYNVTFDGQLLEEDAAFQVPETERTFSFVHHPLNIEGVRAANRDWFEKQEDFALEFNLPVAASDVAEHCVAKSDNEVALEALEPEATGEMIQLRPAEPLQNGETYVFECEGLLAEGGNHPMDMEQDAWVKVHPAFSLLSFSPTADEDPIRPNKAILEIETATPLTYESVQQHVTIEPAVEGFDRGWMSRGRTTFMQEIDLAPQQQYVVKISSELADRFGQTIGEPQEFRFSTEDFSPQLYLETGIYAVEARQQGYPICSRNVSEFEVECAFVPKRKIPQLLTTSMDYDPWYSDGQSAMEWSTLGLRPRTFQVQETGARNEYHVHNVDLTQRCGGRGRKGVYLVEVRSQEVLEADDGNEWRRYPYRVLGNVTDLGILLKAGPSSGLVWVSHLSTGRPAAAAQVTLYNTRGRPVFRGQTDAQGILRTPGSTTLLRQPASGEQDFFDSYRQQRLLAVVEKDGDLATVDGNWANGIQIWNFGVPQDFGAGGARSVRGFILSDRGIYRPGETVHFKGFVRELVRGSAPRLPRGRSVEVVLEDARGTELMRESKRLSEFGGFSFDHALSSEAALGDYYVRAKLGDQTFREQFSVEEVKPVSFEILAKTPREGASRVTGEGEGRRLSIDQRYEAQYLFGAPVIEGDVQWTAYRKRRVVRYPEFRSYSFEDWSQLDTNYFWSRHESGSQAYVAEGDGQTDETGAFRVQFEDQAQDLRGTQDYMVQTTVTDSTGQAVSKRSVVTAHPTGHYLGLHTQEFVQAVRMPFSVNAVAVDHEGRKITRAAFLSLIKRRRQCERVVGPYYRYNCENHDDEVWTRPLQLGAGGVTTEPVEVEEPGEYIFRLHGVDAAGRAVSASSMVWVIGEGQAFWSGDESARMGLIASKEQYEPGEVARLVPQADMDGATALVTTERDGIIDARLVRLSGGLAEVRVPIQDKHAPNVFVSVAAVRGRTGASDDERPAFRMGVANLEVTSKNKELAIEIDTGKEEYEPGETVTGSLRVLSRGRPVRAEVSLSVADEGLLQLINFQTPNPMKAFYKPWGLGVENSTNWNRIVRRRGPTGWEEGEDGEDSASGGEDNFRSRFVASAYWAPALVTDAQGRATFTFEAPDNLTAFRLMVAAADRGSRFGSADQRIRIKKPLMLAPILPRFVQEGDRIQLGAVVHNYTEAAGAVRVRFETEGLELEGNSTQRIEVASQRSGRVTVWARATGTGKEVSFSASGALGAAARDGFVYRLPIRRDLIEDLKVVEEGRLQAGGSVEADLSWEDHVVPAHSELQVTVDPTGLADLEAGLRYLIGYPYGCLEQTMSRLLPMFKVKDLATSLELEGLEDNQSLDRFIEFGVAKVIRHQHGDGQFSLWPSTDTQPYLTAYALHGLLEAKRAGVDVDDNALNLGMRALRRWTNRSQRTLSPGGETATMAMAAYVLAEGGQPDAALNARLFEARNALPLWGKAWLLRAMHHQLTRSRQLDPVQQASLQTLLTEVREGVEVVDGKASVVESLGVREQGHYYGSNIRSAAIITSSLIEVAPRDGDPGHELITPLVDGLKATRTEAAGHWPNTQDNVFALIALSDYARKAGSQSRGSREIVLKMGTQELARGRVDGAGVFHLSKRLSEMQQGPISVESTGAVHYTVKLLLAHAPTGEDRVAAGMSVERHYLHPETGEPIERISAGDVVKVRLTVDPNDRTNHIALVDPIPSGAEILNPDLETTAFRGQGPRRDRWVWVHHEFRDDRTQVFANAAGPAPQSFEYLIRFVRPGTFGVPGVTAEAMYAPHLRARAQGITLQVQP